MANVFGNKLKLSIFGESHGTGIGVVIDGLPAGLKLDMLAIKAEMARRAPGNSALATPRKEPDEVNILSGIFNEMTTG
ncbi:MAG: chorismate synthase, partial [Oscillospiraceae bacterium]